MPEKIKNILLVVVLVLVLSMGAALFYQQKKISKIANFLGLEQDTSQTLGPSLDNQAVVEEAKKTKENEFRQDLPEKLDELKKVKVLSGTVKSAEKGLLKVEATVIDIEKVKKDADIASAPLIKKDFNVLVNKDTFIAGEKTPDKMKEGDTIRVICKEPIYEGTAKILTAETIISPADVVY